MADTLASQAYNAVNTADYAAMSRKGRLEAFAWSYCRTVAEASDDAIEAEAVALGVPRDRLSMLARLVDAEQAKILAEVLRIFGDREQADGQTTEFDRLLDEVMGATGHEGTLPG